MEFKTKCHECKFCEDCNIKNSLNKIVQKVIKKTEESVREEIFLNVEYIIVTDVMVIPTNCPGFKMKKVPAQTLFPSPGEIAKKSLAAMWPVTSS